MEIGRFNLQRLRLFGFVSASAAPGAANPGKMMEEVSVMMAYDANLVEQMSEEEILASLVEETGPKFTVRFTVPGVSI